MTLEPLMTDEPPEVSGSLISIEGRVVESMEILAGLIGKPDVSRVLAGSGRASATASTRLGTGCSPSCFEFDTSADSATSSLGRSMEGLESMLVLGLRASLTVEPAAAGDAGSEGA